MAYSRTVHSPSRRKRKKVSAPHLPLIPEALQSFLARRFQDIFASLFILLGLFIFLSLISYNYYDPSFNAASSAAEPTSVSNWMGQNGAHVSDLLFQTLGLVAFLVPVFLLMWGGRLFFRAILHPFYLRFSAAVLSLFGLCVAFAQVPSGGFLLHPYMGGATGTLLLEFLTGGHVSGEAAGHSMVIFFAGCFGLFALLYAFGVNKEMVKALFVRAVRFLAQAGIMVLTAIFAFVHWVRYYNQPEDAKPQRRTPNRRTQTSQSFDSDYKFELFSFLRPRERDDQPFVSRPEPPVTQVSVSSPEVSAAPQSEPSTSHIPVVAGLKPSGDGQVSAPVRDAPKIKQQKLSFSGGEWEFPSLDLISAPPSEILDARPNEGALRKNAELLQAVLNDFKIDGKIVSIHPGPVVTLYELEPAPGTKSARVIGLGDDIARSMSAVSVRCAVVPGRNVIGIELPNKTRQIVYMHEMLASRLFEKSSAKLPLILGKDIAGQPILADLAKMPHLLVAGTTGSGKSVAVNTMILSLLYRLSPEKCRLIMIDPKMLELSVYDNIPHLLSPVVTDPGKAIVTLKWAVQEMENRYRAMSKLGVRNIEGYNARLRDAAKKGESIMQKVQTGFDPETGQGTFEDQEIDLTELPYIVIVVDEFADLMLVAGKDVENAIQRLAQMARAAGIHLIMATQRPSVDVITGVIKANFPTRISFQVTSKIDSRTILGEGGAEQLLGMGDMLYMAPGGRITRVHGPFCSDGDVENVVGYLKAQGEPDYIDGMGEGDVDFSDNPVMAAMFGEDGGSSGDDKVDELYDQAVAVVAREGKASTSFVQRHLQIGYNRAARIIEEMERQGIISPANATGKREILVRDFSDI